MPRSMRSVSATSRTASRLPARRRRTGARRQEAAARNPVTVKKSYNVAGLPTTWGIPAQKDFAPAEHAVQVARVKAAGGVILAKTNVPFGLRDWQSYNESPAPPTIRSITVAHRVVPPAAPRPPGAGYGPLSLGSDIGGSLRVPAISLRRLCAQADAGARRNARPHPTARAAIAVQSRPQRGRPDGALRGRFVATARRDRRTGSLEAGKAFRVPLPPPRHTGLKNFASWCSTPSGHRDR